MTESRNRVVIVCTANVIRSPFVAGLLTSRMPAAHRGYLEVESAGTQARPAIAADTRVVELGRTYGLDLDAHRSQPLDENVLRPGDTVLCAERAHRRVVLDLRPELIESVFTVREFSRLVEAVHARATTWADLVQAASRARLATPQGREEDDDIVDPVGAPDATWLVFERQATQAVSTILGAMTTLPTPRPTMQPTSTPLSRREYRRSREVPLGERRSARRS